MLKLSVWCLILISLFAYFLIFKISSIFTALQDTRRWGSPVLEWGFVMRLCSLAERVVSSAQRICQSICSACASHRCSWDGGLYAIARSFFVVYFINVVYCVCVVINDNGVNFFVDLRLSWLSEKTMYLCPWLGNNVCLSAAKLPKKGLKLYTRFSPFFLFFYEVYICCC